MWYMFCIKPRPKNPNSTGNSFPHVTATLPWPWTIQSSANLPFIVHVISFLDVTSLLLLPSHFVIIPPLHKFDWPAIRVIILINAKRNVNLAIGCELVWLQVKFVSFCGEQSYPVLDVCSRIAAYLPGHLTNLVLELRVSELRQGHTQTKTKALQLVMDGRGNNPSSANGRFGGRRILTGKGRKRYA